MYLCKKYWLVLLLMGGGPIIIAAEPVVEKLVIGSFSTGLLDHWEAKDFKGETKYSLVDLEGTKVLKAVILAYLMNSVLICIKLPLCIGVGI